MGRERELYIMEDDELEAELKTMNEKLDKCMSGDVDMVLMICKNIDTIRKVQRSRALEKLNQ